MEVEDNVLLDALKLSHKRFVLLTRGVGVPQGLVWVEVRPGAGRDHLLEKVIVRVGVVWRSWREIWEEFKRELIPCISLLQVCIVVKE
ncbi:unnamed protein product [Sphenostylis stenocarpa]|uniref:Uncharacterized protein n=1 Tax=Sphenostylis stenocarpa TaxID=92480 RepID=A0AA86SLD7_9FABA|nr:unnamed protein product [Sphenostylis stenocarpa]